HGLDGAGEIHQQAVAGALHDASLVRGNARLDEFAEMFLEPPKRAFLVAAHEPAIAGDVDRQDCGELALCRLVLHRIRAAMLRVGRAPDRASPSGPSSSI